MTQKTVFKPTLRTATRIAATCCRYSPTGNVVAAGLADGSIQIWDARGAPTSARQAMSCLVLDTVLRASIAATCCHRSPSGSMLAAGLADGSIENWDARGAPLVDSFTSCVALDDGGPARKASCHLTFSAGSTSYEAG